MIWILFSLVFLVTVFFFLLESSFEGLSRISLAKFLKDFEDKHHLTTYYVERYDLAFHTLKTFVFFLQIVLMVLAFHLLVKITPNLFLRLGIVALTTLLLFNTLLYLVGYVHKEFIFKKLFFLFPLAWYVFYPFNRIFSLFLREEGRPDERDAEPDDVSNEEMEVFLEEGTKEGVIKEEDQEMIQSVLEFGDKLVKEIMSPRLDMRHIPIDASLEEIVGIIRTHKKSRYPVIVEKLDNVEGVILAKDLFHYWDQKEFNIREILRPPFFIPETMRIFELLKEMQRTKQKFAIVVDEFGGVSGLVTMEDIIEEIVGDIKDEYDEDVEPIVAERDYYLARGNANIYELCETLDVELGEDEDYQTISGLISFHLGKIPQVGNRVRFQGWILEVVEIEKNRIKKVKIFREAK